MQGEKVHSHYQRYLFVILSRALPTIQVMQLIPIAFWFCRSAWKRQHVTIASDNRFAVFSVLLNVIIGTITSYMVTDTDLNYAMLVQGKVGSHLRVFKSTIRRIIFSQLDMLGISNLINLLVLLIFCTTSFVIIKIRQPRRKVHASQPLEIAQMTEEVDEIDAQNETQMIRTVFVVIAVFVIFWIPYVSMSLLGYSRIIINPILCICVNSEIRSLAKKLKC